MFVLRPGDRFVMIGNGARAYATVNAIHSDTGNWWTVPGKTTVAAYQPKGAASLAASYVNLANPGTYDAAPGVAPTWASGTGWTFNGSTQYLATGVVPLAETWSVIIRMDTNTAASNRGHGVFNSSSAIFAYRSFVSSASVYNGAGAVGGLATTGVVGLAQWSVYLNGSPAGTISSAAWPVAGTREFLIGAVMTATPGSFWAGSVQAFAIYSDTLTAGEVATVSAAMAAL